MLSFWHIQIFFLSLTSLKVFLLENTWNCRVKTKTKACTKAGFLDLDMTDIANVLGERNSPHWKATALEGEGVICTANYVSPILLFHKH